jgi:hypothetical protein
MGTGIHSSETFFTDDPAVMRDVVEALDKLASVRALHPETRRARGLLAMKVRASTPAVVLAWSPKDLAAAAGCSDNNIRKMCDRGTLKSETVGGRIEIDPEAAEQYLRRRQQAKHNRSQPNTTV